MRRRAVKLPTLLAESSLNVSDYPTLQSRLQEFVKFLSKNQARLFVNQYTEVDQAYLDAVAALPPVAGAKGAAAGAAAGSGGADAGGDAGAGAAGAGGGGGGGGVAAAAP
jgi:hypothetical protein